MNKKLSVAPDFILNSISCLLTLSPHSKHWLQLSGWVSNHFALWGSVTTILRLIWYMGFSGSPKLWSKGLHTAVVQIRWITDREKKYYFLCMYIITFHFSSELG